MGIYTRYKKNQDGLRQLVELWETTPKLRRQKIIDLGMEEDPEFTRKILQYVIEVEDILKLPAEDLGIVLSELPGKLTAFAIRNASPELKEKCIKSVKPSISSEIREYLDLPEVLVAQIGGAQLKLIEAARRLERLNKIGLKKIP